MRKVTTLVAVLLLAAAGSALAQSSQILHVSGQSWEEGNFPPSAPGEEYQAVGVLNGIEHPLVWTTSTYSYTWWVRDLISVSESQFGNIRVVTYSGGNMTIYVDWLPSNATYGTNPPNATSPSTFADGISIYLDGYFTDFTLSYNDLTLSGSFSGTLNFTAGDVYPLLWATDGWTFGANLSAVSPVGYDLDVNGDVFLTVVGVEDQSWGNIKALYR